MVRSELEQSETKIGRKLKSPEWKHGRLMAKHQMQAKIETKLQPDGPTEGVDREIGQTDRQTNKKTDTHI